MIPGIIASQQLLTQGDENGVALVSLLTSWDGSDAAMTATDDSTFAHIPTFEGAAQIDTAQSVFGGASVLFSGSGDRVRWPNHVAFDIGNQAFCIEGRLRLSNVTGSSRQVLGVWDTSGGTPQRSWRINYSPDALGGLAFEYSTDGTSSSSGLVIGPGGGAFLVNTWYDFCFERDGADVLRGYIDGVMEDSATGFNSTFFSSSKDLIFGQDPTGSAQFLGWQDETRIIVGAPVYASDAGFTPLATPFPREGIDTVAADAGSFVLIGQDVALSGTGSITMAAAAGSFTFTGQDVTLGAVIGVRQSAFGNVNVNVTSTTRTTMLPEMHLQES